MGKYKHLCIYHQQPRFNSSILSYFLQILLKAPPHQNTTIPFSFIHVQTILQLVSVLPMLIFDTFYVFLHKQDIRV